MDSNFTMEILVVLLFVVYLATVVTTLNTILKEKRDPVKSNAWIVLIITLPYIGLVLYMLFGQNYRRRKILTRKFGVIDQVHERIVKSQRDEFSLSNKIINQDIEKNRQVITLLLNNSRSPLTYNNHLEILNDGTDTFDKIIFELQNAKRFIHIEYYIIKDDEIGNTIADILIEKAQEGVEVRMIYDDVGSIGLSKQFVMKLRDGGVDVRVFLPIVLPILNSRINNRNHRKIIIIDSDKGFTGGINIADKYISGLPHLGHWRDTHLYVEGQATLSLHAVFATDWLFLTKEHLSYENHFAIDPDNIYGNKIMQIASSGPDSDWQIIMQAFFCSIAKAKNHVYISTPYFLPNAAMLTSIKVAALSGLDVRIMIPKTPDSKLVYWATCSYILELIQAKVKIYLYRPGFNHSKIIMIDSAFCSIGTANMDVRSFEANFEVSALIYDRVETVKLEKRFLKDLQECDYISEKSWLSRKKKRTIIEGIARLFTPLL